MGQCCFRCLAFQLALILRAVLFAAFVLASTASLCHSVVSRSNSASSIFPVQKQTDADIVFYKGDYNFLGGF